MFCGGSEESTCTSHCSQIRELSEINIDMLNELQNTKLPTTTEVVMKDLKDELCDFNVKPINLTVKYKSVLIPINELGLDITKFNNFSKLWPHLLINKYTFNVLKYIFPDFDNNEIVNVILHYAANKVTFKNSKSTIYSIFKIPEETSDFISTVSTDVVWDLLLLILRDYTPKVSFVLVHKNNVREYISSLVITNKIIFSFNKGTIILKYIT